MVRLKVRDSFQDDSVCGISIPYGAIKSFIFLFFSNK